MQVFAQGLVGLRDLFIHPNYVSGATMNNIVSVASWFVLFLVIAIPMGWAIYLYLRHRRSKRWPMRPPDGGGLKWPPP